MGGSDIISSVSPVAFSRHWEGKEEAILSVAVFEATWLRRSEDQC
jgi:hypothetical protein